MKNIKDNAINAETITLTDQTRNYRTNEKNEAHPDLGAQNEEPSNSFLGGILSA
jgi:hypothetical protein